MRTSFFILSALCLGLLGGCASGPEEHVWNREVTSAFVAEDGQLYLLPRYDEPMRFNAAPFREYRALMDSPLREAVACAQMYFHEDWRDPANKAKVHGSYALLLRPEQVTAEQAAQFKLERIEVLPREAKAVEERARYYLPMDRTRYALAFDRACNLSQRAVRGRRRAGAVAGGCGTGGEGEAGTADQCAGAADPAGEGGQAGCGVGGWQSAGRGVDPCGGSGVCVEPTVFGAGSLEVMGR